VFVCDRILLYKPDWPGTYCVAQTDLKLTLLLPQLPKCHYTQLDENSLREKYRSSDYVYLNLL
jgi:hypothetical protein